MTVDELGLTLSNEKLSDVDRFTLENDALRACVQQFARWRDENPSVMRAIEKCRRETNGTSAGAPMAGAARSSKGRSSMKTRVPIKSQFDKNVEYPAGTDVVIVEQLDKHTVLAEVRIPDETLVGGARFDTVQIPKSYLEP